MKQIVLMMVLMTVGCYPGNPKDGKSESESQTEPSKEPSTRTERPDPTQPVRPPVRPDPTQPAKPPVRPDPTQPANPPVRPDPTQPANPPVRPDPTQPAKPPEKPIPADTAKNKSCNNVRREFAKLPQQVKYSPTNAVIKAEFIEAHDLVRSFYGLTRLVWDDAIAQYAQIWANYLRDTYNCKMHHRSNLGRRDGKEWGENLAWSVRKPGHSGGEFASSPTWAVLAWGNECKDYDYDANECKPEDPKEMCGHFTQLVWKDSQRFGCGMAVCQDQGAQSEVWVCNYDPAGNITIQYSDGRKEKLKPY